MNIVKLITSNLDRYPDHAGTFQTQLDGADIWGAYLKVGIVPGGVLIIEGFGPAEVIAAERAMAKAKMLGDQMTFGIQEGFWAVMRRAEEETRHKVFSALLSPGGSGGDEGGGLPS